MGKRKLTGGLHVSAWTVGRKLGEGDCPNLLRRPSEDKVRMRLEFSWAVYNMEAEA